MKRKLFTGISALAILASQASAVAMAQAEFPIVDETVTMTYFVGKGPQSNISDWNADHRFWTKYEDMTNVHIDWNQVANEGIEEQRNLTLVSGDLPDVFYSAGFPTTDVFRYGQQGVFMPLNDLLEEHAPNLTALMEKYPEVRQAMTFPDGNIYSLPYIFDKEFVSLRAGAMPWMARAGLEAAGTEMPTTTEEFYETLKGIKETSAETGITIPFGAPSMDMISNYLSGAFGVMNKGGYNGPVDLVEGTDELRFYATSDQYKEMLQYMNRLFSEGLIDNNIYSTDWNTFLANRAEELYGGFIFWGAGIEDAERHVEAYDSLGMVEGPNGDAQYVDYSPMVNSLGTFIVTSENETPEIALEWLDYFYSDEGAEMFYMGVEGETYEMVDGIPAYTEEVQTENVVHYLPWLGNNQGIIQETTFIGSESMPQTVESANKLQPHVTAEPWAAFTHTEEENDFLVSVGADIEKYVREMQDLFISGEMSFDEWDKYVQTLESMSLEQYLSIKQAAYDRTLEVN